MLTASRADALAFSRYLYTRLVERASDAVEGEREYVRVLARSWDDRLLELTRWAAPVTLTEDESLRLDRLASIVIDDQLTPEALVEWVDAFPDAIANLFPAPVANDLEAAIVVAERTVPARPARAQRQPALPLDLAA